MLYPIYLYSDKLRRPCAPVTKFDDDLKALILSLFETATHVGGIGLSANQVHIFQQVSVINIPEREFDGEGKPTGKIRENKYVLINPVIEERDGEETMREGCLSLPNHLLQAPVRRAKEVLVRTQDEYGEEHRYVFEGLMARAVQHECDHLQGKLYVDHLGKMGQRLIWDKFNKHVAAIKSGKMRLRDGYKVYTEEKHEVASGVGGD